MHSATGAVPVIRWPVGSTSPDARALRSRSSTGSTPTAAARRSICASWAKQTCTAPNPRMAPHGGLLVRTTTASMWAFGSRYGPQAKRAALAMTADDEEAYAPPSSTTSASTFTSTPVAGGVVPVAEPGRMAVDVAEEGLVAQVAHLHRPPGGQRQQAGVDLHAHVLAPAEGATDAAQVQAHVVGGEPEAGGDLVAVLVQPLGRHPQVDAAGAVGHGQARLGPEEGLVLHADLVGALDHHLAVGPGPDVAVGDHDPADDVALGVDRRGGGGGVGVHQRRQHLVGDGDGLERPAGRVGVVGRHRGHGLADEAHDVTGEHGLVGRDQPVGGGAGHVVGGDDAGHAGDGQRRPDVDGRDAGVRVG